MITKTGGASGAELSTDLYRETHAFCASKNMDFHKISVDEKDWKAFVRLASSKLEFCSAVSYLPKILGQFNQSV